MRAADAQRTARAHCALLCHPTRAPRLPAACRYTVRGNWTCASRTPPAGIRRPGSAGHEALDAATYVKWGAQYLKDDTCGAPETPYPVMGRALNGTGTPVFFSLCEPGQGPVTAPQGRATGNGWRVDEDDGGLWRPILDNVSNGGDDMHAPGKAGGGRRGRRPPARTDYPHYPPQVNMNAPLYPYAGCDEQHSFDGHGCGWNDMGLLMVGGGMTPDQDASHMALWAIMASKLLISVDPRTFSPAALALVTNDEVIAIDQDGLKLQGQRVEPPVNASRSAEDAERIRRWKREHLEGGSWRAAGRVRELLDAEGGPDAGAVPGTEEDDVLAAGGRVEVWQRQLEGGAWALLLFNNGIPGDATTINCTGPCWTRMGWAAGAAVDVRDVLARSDNGSAIDGFQASVRSNASVLVRLAMRCNGEQPNEGCSSSSISSSSGRQSTGR